MTGNKEIGISFRAEPNSKILQATAEVLKQYAFDVVSVYEDLGDQSPMYPLFEFAKHHESARLGPACIAVAKHPSMDLIVGDISRLNDLVPGRAYLGLAAGAWMDYVGLKTSSVKRVREAVETSKYLLEKREEGYEGEFYKIKPGFKVNYETPEIKVPLLIGAWGRNMTALAGEIADEIKIGGSANPLMLGIVRNRLAIGACRVGRNVNEVGVVLGAVTVVSDDRKEALRYARQKAASYINIIATKDPTAMADFPDEIGAIKTAMATGNIEEAVRCMPDALAKRFMFAGSVGDIIQQTEAIFNAGGDRVEYGTPHGLDGIEGLHILGKKVLPYFK